MKKIAEYSLDVRADSYLRCVCVDGETMFLLRTIDEPELACQVLAFDLARGEVLGTYQLGYIKHDNGGGTLSATAAGRRVAVGSEFSIFIFDLVDGEFIYCRALGTEQHTCAARFLDPDRTIHWAWTDDGIDAFESTDLRTGESYLGPEVEDELGALEDFEIEPDGRHLVAIGDAKREASGYRTALHRIDVRDFQVVANYEVPGYVVRNFIVTDGHAYFVSSTYLMDLNLTTGKFTVLADQIVRAPLSGYTTCMRTTPDGLVHVVTQSELISVPNTGLGRFASAFPRAVQGAGFDAGGRLWTIDEASKVIGWELS